MKWRHISPQTRMQAIAIAILVLGLGSAILIYLFAETAPENPLGYEPEETKRYVHDMLLYGGKANLLGSQFMHWLGELWQGKQLAFTIVCIALLVAGALWYVSAALPPDADAGSVADKQRNENDA